MASSDEEMAGMSDEEMAGVSDEESSEAESWKTSESELAEREQRRKEKENILKHEMLPLVNEYLNTVGRLRPLSLHLDGFINLYILRRTITQQNETLFFHMTAVELVSGLNLRRKSCTWFLEGKRQEFISELCNYTVHKDYCNAGLLDENVVRLSRHRSPYRIRWITEGSMRTWTKSESNLPVIFTTPFWKEWMLRGVTMNWEKLEIERQAASGEGFKSYRAFLCEGRLPRPMNFDSTLCEAAYKSTPLGDLGDLGS